MLLLSCLMLAGGVFYWQKNENGFVPEITRAPAEAAPRDGLLPSEEAERWIPATEPLTVNINTADAALLERLPGIGPGKAAAILAYREEHGPFSCAEELMKVPGIKEGIFSRLKDYVTV